LEEFSPTGDCLIWAFLKKLQNLGYFSHSYSQSYALILKKWLVGDFFTSPSGHPDFQLDFNLDESVSCKSIKIKK
jgi:hypothetical protein